MEDKRLVSALILFLMVPSFGFSQTSIETFPQSKIVSQDALSSTQRFELITGKVRRINSLLSPESVLVVMGEKQSKTLLSATRRNAEEIYQYYLDQLKTNAEVIFQCSGRDCGPSTYWANKVYQTSLLYGPEQYQRYIVAKVDTFQSYYLLIYIGQRATGQVYVQHEALFPEVLENQMQSTLAETYRHVLPWNFDENFDESFDENYDKKFDKKLIEQIENIVADTQSQYILVVHDKMREGESFDQALSRTEELADTLKKRFGHKETLSRLRFHGAGPISPLRDGPQGRVELIKLR